MRSPLSRRPYQSRSCLPVGHHPTTQERFRRSFAHYRRCLSNYPGGEVRPRMLSNISGPSSNFKRRSSAATKLIPAFGPGVCGRKRSQVASCISHVASISAQHCVVQETDDKRVRVRERQQLKSYSVVCLPTFSEPFIVRWLRLRVAYPSMIIVLGHDVCGLLS